MYYRADGLTHPAANQVAGGVIEGDGGQQQADVTHIPPAIEKQRGRCQPERGHGMAGLANLEKAKPDHGQKAEDENVRVKKHAPSLDNVLCWQWPKLS